jgi:hypothetical protein
MSERVKVGTRRKFGPYKGSKQNGGREIYVWKVKTEHGWKTESKNRDREDYEERTGRKLSKNTDVDHKDNNKNNHSKSNLHTMSHSANVAKEDRHRAHKRKSK